MKQHELIAVEADLKKQTKKEQTEIYHLFQKRDLFSGHEKIYRPFDEEGEQLPNKSKKVERDVAELLEEYSKKTAGLIDHLVTKDVGNTLAKADIVLGETVIAKDVPVLSLLTLETELQHLQAVLKAIPTLSLDKDWIKDEGSGRYKTATEKQVRTKKTPRVLVHFEPTDKHPGKSETYQEDVPVGNWHTVDISTALPEKKKKELLERVGDMIFAVKKARERANTQEVEMRRIGKKIMENIFFG